MPITPMEVSSFGVGLSAVGTLFAARSYRRSGPRVKLNAVREYEEPDQVAHRFRVHVRIANRGLAETDLTGFCLRWGKSPFMQIPAQDMLPDELFPLLPIPNRIKASQHLEYMFQVEFASLGFYDAYRSGWLTKNEREHQRKYGRRRAAIEYGWQTLNRRVWNLKHFKVVAIVGPGQVVSYSSRQLRKEFEAFVKDRPLAPNV